MKNRKWYRMTNLSQTEADVYIYDQIGQDFWGDGIPAKQFVQDLNALSVDKINLHINSPGGSIFDGHAIYNALRNHQAKIHVTVDGIAASIASEVAMAGDTVEMPANAMMMIHDPSGYTIGTSDDMRKTADALDKMKLGIISAYVDKTGMDDTRLADMMTDETWFTADEAVKHGFADHKTAAVTFQANFDLLGKFQKTPNRLMAIPAAQSQNKTGGSSMELTLEKLKAEYPQLVNAIADEAAAKVRKEITDAAGEANDEAKKAGATAELQRMKDVKEQLIPGHEELIDKLMFDGETTGEQAAIQVLAAEKALRNQALQNLQDDGTPVVPVIPPAAGANAKTGPIEDRAKSEWENSADIRKEFVKFSTYLAFRRVEEENGDK